MRVRPSHQLSFELRLPHWRRALVYYSQVRPLFFLRSSRLWLPDIGICTSWCEAEPRLGNCPLSWLFTLYLGVLFMVRRGYCAASPAQLHPLLLSHLRQCSSCSMCCLGPPPTRALLPVPAEEPWPAPLPAPRNAVARLGAPSACWTGRWLAPWPVFGQTSCTGPTRAACGVFWTTPEIRQHAAM